MTRASIAIGLLLAAQSAFAGEPRLMTSHSADARTAGASAADPEAESTGRAILAWRIASGSFDGVPLDGLTVTAAVASDPNGEVSVIDGEGQAGVRAIVSVDPRATRAQRAALVALVRELSGGVISEVVKVESAPVRFATTSKYVEVSVPDTLERLVYKK